jgi:hypothetical protein
VAGLPAGTAGVQPARPACTAGAAGAGRGFLYKFANSSASVVIHMQHTCFSAPRLGCGAQVTDGGVSMVPKSESLLQLFTVAPAFRPAGGGPPHQAFALHGDLRTARFYIAMLDPHRRNVFSHNVW